MQKKLNPPNEKWKNIQEDIEKIINDTTTVFKNLRDEISKLDRESPILKNKKCSFIFNNDEGTTQENCLKKYSLENFKLKPKYQKKIYKNTHTLDGFVSLKGQGNVIYEFSPSISKNYNGIILFEAIRRKDSEDLYFKLYDDIKEIAQAYFFLMDIRDENLSKEIKIKVDNLIKKLLTRDGEFHPFTDYIPDLDYENEHWRAETYKKTIQENIKLLENEKNLVGQKLKNDFQIELFQLECLKREAKYWRELKKRKKKEVETKIDERMVVLKNRKEENAVKFKKKINEIEQEIVSFKNELDLMKDQPDKQKYSKNMKSILIDTVVRVRGKRAQAFLEAFNNLKKKLDDEIRANDTSETTPVIESDAVDKVDMDQGDGGIKE